MSDKTSRIEPPKLPEDIFSTALRRMKNHRVAQWAVGYVAVAYGIQHAVTLTSEAYEWPKIVARLSMTLLALGLPLAVTLAWYHGERVSRRISAGEMAIVSVMLVGISFAFYLFIRPAAYVASRGSAAQEASVTAARQAAANPHGAISVAVLPFLNLSGDKEQEFFSDGMTEEITAALAKVPDMRVVARTSAFEFKDKNVNIKTMGQELGATHLIEGSVRKAGNRLRITAQLIRADDGTHIWAEDYDRDLTDVFAVQEDIARAITASLRMPLGLKPGENLVNNRNIDPELYQQYLRARAKALADPRQVVRVEALKSLENVVARDPGFAPAWAFISRLILGTQDTQSYWNFWNQPVEVTRRQLNDAMDRAEQPAREAIRLDPRLAEPYLALAIVEGHRKHWTASDDMIRKALDLDPSDPDVLATQGAFLLRTGRVKQALQVIQNAQSLEPLAPAFNTALGSALLANNQAKAAIAVLEAKPFSQSNRFSVLAQAYAAAGQFEKSADVILQMKETGGGYSAAVGPSNIELAARLMGDAPTKVKDPNALPPLHEWLSFTYGYAGANDRLLDFPERALLADAFFFDVRYLFEPAYTSARKTERFKNLVRKAGLVDYWRAKGWPDLCHPTTDDFECS